MAELTLKELADRIAAVEQKQLKIEELMQAAETPKRRAELEEKKAELEKMLAQLKDRLAEKKETPPPLDPPKPKTFWEEVFP